MYGTYHVCENSGNSTTNSQNAWFTALFYTHYVSSKFCRISSQKCIFVESRMSYPALRKVNSFLLFLLLFMPMPPPSPLSSPHYTSVLKRVSPGRKRREKGGWHGNGKRKEEEGDQGVKETARGDQGRKKQPRTNEECIIPHTTIKKDKCPSLLFCLICCEQNVDNSLSSYWVNSHPGWDPGRRERRRENGGGRRESKQNTLTHMKRRRNSLSLYSLFCYALFCRNGWESGAKEEIRGWRMA